MRRSPIPTDSMISWESFPLIKSWAGSETPSYPNLSTRGPMVKGDPCAWPKCWILRSISWRSISYGLRIISYGWLASPFCDGIMMDDIPCDTLGLNLDFRLRNVLRTDWICVFVFSILFGEVWSASATIAYSIAAAAPWFWVYPIVFVLISSGCELILTLVVI